MFTLRKKFLKKIKRGKWDLHIDNATSETVRTRLPEKHPLMSPIVPLAVGL